MQSSTAMSLQVDATPREGKARRGRGSASAQRALGRAAHLDWYDLASVAICRQAVQAAKASKIHLTKARTR